MVRQMNLAKNPWIEQIILFTLFVLLTTSHSFVFSKEKPKLSSAFYASLSMSVLKVLAPGDGRLYSGSGVIVGSGEVLTNCHVIRNSNKVYVMKGALRYNVTKVKVNMFKDLCLLEAPTLNLPAVNLIKPSKVKVADMAYFYGYPGGADAFFTEGRVSGLHPMNDSFVVKTTAGFSSGGSGGGLFDSQGNLIGITTFFSAGHSGGYYALPSDWIEELRLSESSVIKPLEGLAFWELPLEDQPNFLKFARFASDRDWKEAIIQSKSWMKEEPDNFDALLSHGKSLLNNGFTQEAIDVLESARSLSPDDANILFALKNAFEKSSSDDKLLEVIRVLETIDPEEVSAGKCNMAC